MKVHKFTHRMTSRWNDDQLCIAACAYRATDDANMADDWDRVTCEQCLVRRKRIEAEQAAKQKPDRPCVHGGRAEY
jgi:hypothetical protein